MRNSGKVQPTHFILYLLALLLVACGGGGGGGGGGSNSPPATTYSIAGTVSTASGPASGVSIALSGVTSATTSTDANGNYSFSGLANGNYTVTPSASGQTFTPANTAVEVSGANVTGTNFTETAAAVTYSISGTVTGAAQAGVTITVSGSNTATTTTNSSGAYTVTGLAPGSYTVAATLAGYTFSPPSTGVTIAAANVTAINFTSTVVQTTYSISGTVTSGSPPTGLAGVAMTLSGHQSANTTTDANGNYSFTGLTNGSYSVAPALSGYTFSPASTGVSISNASNSSTNFTGTAAAATYTLSGTISGPFVRGILVTLTGANTGSTTTNASGNYSFSGLTAGTYTVTPSLAGYSYAPTSASVNLAANATQNFAASSLVSASSISGTISYAGSKTGNIYVVAIDPYGNALGTTVTLTGQTANYSIRGFTNSSGSYTVSAFLDAANSRSQNAVDPTGVATATVSAIGTNVSGVNLTLTDPASLPTPTAPNGVQINGASNGTAVVTFTPDVSNGVETATTYKVYWGTDTAASNGGSLTVPAVGENHNGPSIITGLTNGTAYYFRVTALVGSSESTATPVGPVTVGNTTGANTVSGVISFPVSATGPLYAGLYNQSTGQVYFAVVPAPVSPQTFSVAGVPNGSNYQAFAIIDMNNDGRVDTGDLSNTQGRTVPVTVSGNTTVNESLSSANALPVVSTQHQTNGNAAQDSYNLNFSIESGVKLPVAATLVSGPKVAVPADIAIISNGNELSLGDFLGSTVPTVGDSYKFQLTYSDGTSEFITKSVTAVLSNFATSLTTSGSNPLVPTFDWSAPSVAPAALPYTYEVWVNVPNGGQVWGTNNDLSSSQTSVVYDADGSASVSSLTAGVLYDWTVTVRDANGNQASYTTTYTP